MPTEPIGRGLAMDYREALYTSNSPTFIDTDVPIGAVAVTNFGVIRPRSNQRIYRYMVNIGAAVGSTQVQIATKTQNTRVYLLAVKSQVATSGQFVLYDSTTASGVPADGSSNALFFHDVVGLSDFMPTVAIECLSGLRLDKSTGAGGQLRSIVHYMIEDTLQ